MKKFISLMLVIINTMLFTGCGSLDVNLESPEVKTLIEGQWRVEAIEDATIETDIEEGVVGSILSFSNDEVILFGKVYNNISYKAKVVDRDEYLYDVMGYLPEYISREDKEVRVITISADNTFIKDIMVVEDRVYIIEGNRIFRLVQTDKLPLFSINEHSSNNNNDKYYDMDSGVLLGLRSEGDDGTEYRTLWISLESGEIKTEELPYILLPRKSGFFKVTNKRQYNADNYFKDTIVFTDLNGKSKEFICEGSRDVSENINVDRDITFIGNDYMSTKTITYDENNEDEVLNTYILDMNSLGSNSSVPLGTLTNIQDMNNILVSKDSESHINSKDINTFTNFAIKRKQGRWGFFTLKPNHKIDNLNEDSNNDTKLEKVDITLRVSEKISRHDEIFTSWQGIQKQVPSAIDAISSPNRNLAVIKTKSNLYIYKIVNNNLNMESEVVIPLGGKEAIVMAEWALGDYVSYWSDQVKSLLNEIERK